MIEGININKKFADRVVLENVNVSFDKGKTNLIIGQSGMGKTVLVKCLVGLIEPDTGVVRFDGRPFSKMSYSEMKQIRQEIGMLFQGGALFDSMTAVENVMFPLTMFTAMTYEEKLERANWCLSRVNLVNVNKMLPSELSGGMKKRVALARAIALNPKYLFCDEPNSGLDPVTACLIDELIGEITHESDITTVVVTHDISSVLKTGEKIYFMYDGRITWQGDRNNILQTDSPELQNFVFASELTRRLKPRQ
ncbi:MAG TPA: ATP-binding cassette domain-containing protein [Bacteroidales bacterium]|nr:ATP-binding cassette domain-containing protein [Bacteroidales bacterium]HPT02465.1 ATP-binding cassette domain-containing protein [Bacteroidales bacterium]